MAQRLLWVRAALLDSHGWSAQSKEEDEGVDDPEYAELDAKDGMAGNATHAGSMRDRFAAKFVHNET